MRLWLTGLCILIAAALGALAWSRNEATAPVEESSEKSLLSRLIVDSTEWNFGAVKQEGGNLTRSFTIRNTGSEPCSIKVATRGCGCMDVKAAASVGPQSETQVEVTLDPARQNGPFVGTVDIATGDAQTPVLYFRLTADSVPRLTLKPDLLVFADAAANATVEQSLDVVSRWDASSPRPTMPVVVAESPALSCELRDTDDSGESSDQVRRITHRFVVRVDLPKLLQSNTSPTVQTQIRITGGGHGQAVVPVRISRRPPVRDRADLCRSAQK